MIRDVAAASPQSASVPTLAADSAGIQQATLAASRRIEPLLLFLFGSALLLLGTAINLRLAKKLKRKSVQAMTGSK